MYIEHPVMHSTGYVWKQVVGMYSMNMECVRSVTPVRDGFTDAGESFACFGCLLLDKGHSLGDRQHSAFPGKS